LIDCVSDARLYFSRHHVSVSIHYPVLRVTASTSFEQLCFIAITTFYLEAACFCREYLETLSVRLFCHKMCFCMSTCEKFNRKATIKPPAVGGR